MKHRFDEFGSTTRRFQPAGRFSAPPVGDGVPVVLVTGGGGFLGRHIVRRLLANGNRVRVLGRKPYPDLAEAGADCRQGDVADADAVARAMEGVNAVVHTAALPGVWGDYQVYYRTNYLGTKIVLDAALAEGVRKLVYTSTPSVVHGGRSIEGGREALSYPDSFLTHYASTKALAERLVLKMNCHALATCSIRPHLIFGPGDNQLIPKLITRARTGRLRRVGDGRNLVSVSYVENVADAHICALDRLGPDSAVAGQAYFINEPEPVNCWDFINRIVVGSGLKKIERGIPFSIAYAVGWMFEKTYALLGRKDDPLMTRFLATQLATSHWFKTDKAQKELGWKPAVSLDEGVERLLKSLG